MAPNPDNDLAGIAILNGGPMDGREHAIEGDTDELSVIMLDGQKHHYARTEYVQPLPGGRSALVFSWTGRYYGPQ